LDCSRAVTKHVKEWPHQGGGELAHTERWRRSFLDFICDRVGGSALQLNIEAHSGDGAVEQRIGQPSPALSPIVKNRRGPTQGDNEIRAYGNDNPEQRCCRRHVRITGRLRSWQSGKRGGHERDRMGASNRSIPRENGAGVSWLRPGGNTRAGGAAPIRRSRGCWPSRRRRFRRWPGAAGVELRLAALCGANVAFHSRHDGRRPCPRLSSRSLKAAFRAAWQRPLSETGADEICST
jgi:hypothetical protein